MFVITRMDAETAQFDEVVASLQATFGPECTPLMIPIGSGNSFTGVVNLLHPPQCLIPAGYCGRTTGDSYGIGHLW